VDRVIASPPPFGSCGCLRKGTRVVSIFKTLIGLKGTITQDHGNFAYVKWDDPKHRETSEYYSVIVPEEWYENNKDEINRSTTKGENTMKNQTWYQWAREFFEFENCDECKKGVGGDKEAYDPLGNYFALCKKPTK